MRYEEEWFPGIDSRGSHTLARLDNLLLHLTLWLLIYGLNTHFLPLFPLQAVFKISTHQQIWNDYNICKPKFRILWIDIVWCQSLTQPHITYSNLCSQAEGNKLRMLIFTMRQFACALTTQNRKEVRKDLLALMPLFRCNLPWATQKKGQPAQQSLEVKVYKVMGNYNHYMNKVHHNHIY